MSQSKRPAPSHPLTPIALRRIQGAVAKSNGGGVPKGSYVSRMQRHLAGAQGEGEK